jgi:hypothetical protein
MCHGERCYMCGCPLDLKTMEVDHVIPESLQSDPERLAEVLLSFGRPTTFSLNSYENWMPSCRPCNGRKLALVFEPTPLIQALLQKAALKAGEAAALAVESVSKKKIANAINVLQRADERGELSEEIRTLLLPLIAFQVQHRSPEMVGEVIRLTPLFTVLSDDGLMQVVQGPYGVGGRPTSPTSHGTWKCSSCGSAAAWNGARCVICGQMDDD